MAAKLLSVYSESVPSDSRRRFELYEDVLIIKGGWFSAKTSGPIEIPLAAVSPQYVLTRRASATFVAGAFWCALGLIAGIAWILVRGLDLGNIWFGFIVALTICGGVAAIASPRRVTYAVFRGARSFFVSSSRKEQDQLLAFVDTVSQQIELVRSRAGLN